VQPANKPWPVTEQFLREIVCNNNKEDYTHFIKILAKWMRNPLMCGEVGIILLSSQGTGKGTLSEFLSDLFGRAHSLTTASQDSLLGKHNDHLLGRLFVFLDEATFGGDHRAGDKLKQMINAPNIEIEPKFQSRFSIVNRLHFMIASNSSKSVPLNTDDRRWHVLEVSDKMKNNRAYFGALRKAWWGGEREGFLHYLLDNTSVDLTNFDPRPPVNDAKEQLMDAVASGPDRFLKQMILDCGEGILPDAQQTEWQNGPISLPSSDLFDAYKTWCADTGNPDRYANPAVVGKTINYMLGLKRATEDDEVFGVLKHQVREGKKRVWTYILPKNDLCIARLEAAGITAPQPKNTDN
jgi:phage/plasmid-associated DNA primase